MSKSTKLPEVADLKAFRAWHKKAQALEHTRLGLPEDFRGDEPWNRTDAKRARLAFNLGRTPEEVDALMTQNKIWWE